MSTFDPSAYLTQLQRQMDAMMQQTQEHAAAMGETEVTGVGEVLDGQVRVTLSLQNGADEVWIDPKAMRKGSEDLAEYLREAISLAYKDLSANMSGEEGPLTALNTLMNDVGGESGDFNAGVKSMQNQLRQQLDKTVADLEARRERLKDVFESPRRNTGGNSSGSS